MADLTPPVVEPQADDTQVLAVSDLRVSFQTPHGIVNAVNGLSYTIRRGDAVGILGESGSGKSVGVGAVMGLLDSPPARIEGQVRYRDTDLMTASPAEARGIRGDRISIVFQDAAAALNPGLSIGYQISEMYRVHRPGTSRTDALNKAVSLLDQVKIPSARQRVHSYAHEFSGGMSQRVMIAMAIALEPDVLIADEPTTALDVTVQAQIMQLLDELRQTTGMALILITHDIGVVAETTERIMVMYAGRVVESGPTEDVVSRPSHPYTVGLMDSIPRARLKHSKLRTIEGSPPVLTAIPNGCAFHPRCSRRQAICSQDMPELQSVAPERMSACHFAAEVLGG
ncbi:MAG: ABC transporter ATP-binding protein [Hyphomicrobiales bacterium]|nr:ABC transporter ATP-binding protein [Hyphomicrobiales bacterium]